MKIIKIGALWCGACLITNKAWKKLQEEYSFDAVDLDYDIDEDEVKSYHPGDILPVFIFEEKNKELGRLIGEVSYQELENKYIEVGGKNE